MKSHTRKFGCKAAGMTISVEFMPNVSVVAFSPKNPRVVAVIYDQLAVFEFGIAAEIFGLHRPEMGPDWYQFAVCASEPGPIRAGSGLRIAVDGGLDLLADAGTVIIPGWRLGAAPIPAALLTALQGAHRSGARIVSICTGAFVLAAAGILSGKRATTHWRHAGELAASYPDIRVEADVLYIDEGSVLTSAGSAAGIDLALHIVRRDFGAGAASHVARRLVVAPHREGSQAQFIERPVPEAREGARLGPLLDRMRSRLDQEQTVEILAAEAGMSERTFVRRFKGATGASPGEWQLAERLARARELLETTTLPVDDIAANCGLGSGPNLRHHFRARLQTSPVAYRKRFAKV